AYRTELQAKCNDLRAPAGPPASFETAGRTRVGSDRFVNGTPPTLLRNAKIWTGARSGTEVVYGDVLLDKGLVMAVGYIPPTLLESARSGGVGLKIQDVGGKWVTPGLVDLHSHIGVYSSPALNGASDGNSRKSPILPWLRSIDGLNTHDASYELAIAGGVTTAQILPGSANNIGGQSFVIKLRSTTERSATSRVVEPPHTLTKSSNGTNYVRWRHMKHACGENPDRLYGQTRMDGQWNFRHAYNEARKVKEAQDAFCQNVDAGRWSTLMDDKLPESLQWESLVDVLRGRVKLSIHCYEAVDLDGIVRLSNEFEFPVASFHHAGETYLVPDLLKKTWGGVPSIALFASNFRKKREAYRGSEFAPRVLAENGIPVVMKSDHPVVNSRYLLFEAQQAHYYGLSPALALASVTSTPAKAAGMGHRVGTIAEGACLTSIIFCSDIVIWDSHPLSLGATPTQVYIDGIPQLDDPQTLIKPANFQVLPESPNWDREAKEAVEWEGLPPLNSRKSIGKDGPVRLVGVKEVLQRTSQGIVEPLFEDKNGKGRAVLVRDGEIVCVEDGVTGCTEFGEVTIIDLKGGSLAPGLTTYGSPLGLVEIRLEPTTNDGPIHDPLINGDSASILGKDVIRAVDGLQFEGRNTLLAYRAGVTTAITAPSGSGFLQGLSTAFRVGAPHALAKGSIVQEETALHVTISPSLTASVSTQVSALRTQLIGSTSGAWNRVREAQIPLVVAVDSADIMATLIALKVEYEAITGKDLRLTFSGATEAHLLAEQIAKAGISVVLTSPRPYPGLWEQRRILPGPPLSSHSSITALLSAGVRVAVGVVDESSARNTRFEIAWAALESNGTLHKYEAIALASSNLDRALGLSHQRFGIHDLVMYEAGGILDFSSKVVGVVSPERQVVDLF
ncbi:hypothetical protein B0H34DRAFT_614504, partial [Crassisporium funariophilum]